MADKNDWRIVIIPTLTGWIVGKEELIEMPGLAPGRVYAWQDVEGSFRHAVTWDRVMELVTILNARG